MNRTVYSLVLALLPIGCMPVQSLDAGSDVVLRAAPAPAVAGDSLRLLLENRSEEPIGYNLCTSSIERRAAEGWQAVPSDRVCTLELRILEPGGEAHFAFQLATELPSGEYRALTGVERMERGERTEVATEPFRIGD